MNIYCNANGSIFHVDPSRVFQGSVGVDVVRFIGRFPSSAQVLMAYKLPNGTWTSPKMLTPVAELEEIQDASGGKFSVWEGRIGASPKIDGDGAIVKDENGNVVFDLDYTITENYGTATIQFFVYGATAPITVNGVIQNVGNGLLATASFSFEIEKGVPAVIPEVDTDDAQALLTQILNVVANTQTLYGNVSKDVTKLQKDVQDLDKNKVNKSGDTMNGPLTVESQGGPAKTEVSEQGVFVTNDGEKGTAYDDGVIVNQGKRIVIPLKDGTVALAENVVASVELQLFELDYKLTLRARAADTRILSESTIDLPLESMVVGGEYDEETQEIVLTLQNGNQVSFPVDKLVTGLISSSEKGAPNGVASLDADGKVPKEQLPDDIGGGDVTKEYVAEEIAKVHKVYTGNSDYALRKGTLLLFVTDIASGATVYIKGENSSKMYSVESANYGYVVATNHVYNADDDTYTLNTLTYDVPTDAAMEDFITPVGVAKTLVSDTDYASDNKAGVVRTNGNFGLAMGWSNENDLIRIYPADEEAIKNKTSTFKPIAPKTLDYAVKVGITTNTETLTDEEKTSACEWLGAIQKATTANVLLANGAFIPWAYNTAGNSMMRRLGNGSAQVAMADNPTDVDIVNVGYVDGKYAELLARIEALETK